MIVSCHALATAAAFHVPFARLALIQAYVQGLQFYASSIRQAHVVVHCSCCRSNMHCSRSNVHDHACDAIAALTTWAAHYVTWLLIK